MSKKELEKRLEEREDIFRDVREKRFTFELVFFTTSLGVLGNLLASFFYDLLALGSEGKYFFEGKSFTYLLIFSIVFFGFLFSLWKIK